LSREAAFQQGIFVSIVQAQGVIRSSPRLPEGCRTKATRILRFFGYVF
jgi:hypothetical protein